MHGLIQCGTVEGMQMLAENTLTIGDLVETLPSASTAELRTLLARLDDLTLVTKTLLRRRLRAERRQMRQEKRAAAG